MKNLLVIQSGGPTAVINSSLAGVIKGGFDNGDQIGKVYGGLYGIERKSYLLRNLRKANF